MPQVVPLHVDEAVDQPKLDIDAWISLKKFGQSGRQMTTPEGGWCVDSDMANRKILRCRQLGARELHFLNDGSCPLGERSASRGWPDGVCIAAYQLAAKRTLQRIDTPRYR